MDTAVVENSNGSTSVLDAEPSKQPRALYLLFFFELWERFSFYGIQGLLVLYVTHKFGFTDTSAYALYGAYLALNYGSPVLGGYLADRVLGFRYAILLGASCIIIGNIFLTHVSINSLYLGMAFIIAGTCFFKSNVSSLLGTFYESNDHRRDRGFTIFYMGINIGGLAGPIVYGLVARHFGYHMGFILGSLGMLSGVVVYALKRHVLGDRGIAPDHRLKLPHTKILLYTALVAALAVFIFFMRHTNYTGWMLNIFGIAVLIYIATISIKLEKIERERIFVLVMFCVFALIFFACQLQMGSSLTLFVERNVNRQLFGFTIPTTIFFASEALCVIAMAPVIAFVWKFLAARNKEPRLPLKFVIGLFFASFSFMIFAFAAHQAKSTGYCSPWWVLLGYTVMAFGELSLSPIGLSAITEYAPSNMTGFFIGAWFLATAFSGYFSGVLANLTSVAIAPHQVLNLHKTATLYQSAFGKIALAVLIISFIAWAMVPWLNKLLQAQSKA